MKATQATLAITGGQLVERRPGSVPASAKAWLACGTPPCPLINIRGSQAVT
jgi:hypothetical protein